MPHAPLIPITRLHSTPQSHSIYPSPHARIFFHRPSHRPHTSRLVPLASATPNPQSFDNNNNSNNNNNIEDKEVKNDAREEGFAPSQRKLRKQSRTPRPHPTLKAEAKASNQGVYDQLINVFMTRAPEDWRRLIAHSTQWPHLADGVLKRMEERACEVEAVAAAEGELEEDGEGLEVARSLRRTARRLATVNQEMSEYAALVQKFREAPSREWESLVALHRNSLGTDFFGYIELKVSAITAAAAAAGKDSSREAENLAALGAQLAVLVEAHDRILADESALDAAAERFSELLQAESMDAAETKLDELAASGKLDPALLLTMAKAYAGVKETDITKEEVKDIMAHLYFKAKETFARQAPVEARILKFLLSVESTKDRMALMEQAFMPGGELSSEDKDFLSTTPQALLNTIENVLAVYDNTSGSPSGNASATSSTNQSMASQAASLMNPEVIVALREMQQAIRKQFL